MDANLKDGWIGVINGRPQEGTGPSVRCARGPETFSPSPKSPATATRCIMRRHSPWASVFGKLIVQGGVTSGILNAVAAENIPGAGSVFLEVAWKFVKAVGVGELNTSRVEVREVRADKPICKLETSVRNEAGALCLTGTATVFTVPLAMS